HYLSAELPISFKEIHDDARASSSQQSTRGTSKWAISLEHLLEDEEGVKHFRDFLKREFSEENVLFWLACEEFKHIQDKRLLHEKAQQIYSTFLSSKSSTQVNVEGQSRLSESMLAEPHPLMFQKLQDQIFTLMKYDSYNRFLKSAAFQRAQQKEESRKGSPDTDESVPKRASRIYNR
uniref:Regulator of G protein signaling 10 n=1 Tax=Callorhinchus milii TaxID=7868 RepID=A0A4W3I1P3_CALMI